MVRPYRDADSITVLTDLLHRAYAPLAAAGMRFVATYQSEEVTRDRINRGTCFVAERRGELVGTITLYPPEPHCPAVLYRQPDVWHFGQFAVEPRLQGKGIGVRLLKGAKDAARAQGARRLALDTSERAEQLISLYRAWGFDVVETVQWEETNYLSVVMCSGL